VRRLGLALLVLAGLVAPRAAAGLPEALPKLVVKGEDAELRFAFMGQLRFTFTDEDVTAAPAGTERFTLQRVRPILLGRFVDGKLGFKLHLNTGPTSLELLDLFVDYRVSDALRLRVGQQKIPFTRYRLDSFARLAFVDWSPAARAFGAERQIGLTADGRLGGGLGYAAGLYTGANARAAFEKGLAQAYGETLDNPSRLDDPAAPARVHPELVLHGTWTHGDDRFDTTSDAKGGPLRLLAGLSAAWDLRPVAARDLALRVGAEVMAKLYGLSAAVVGYVGTFEGFEGGGMQAGLLGLTAQAAYRFGGMWEVSLRYARTQILRALRSDALARAATDSDLATPPDFAFRQEATLGFNVYLIGNQLKWQSDVALQHDGPGRDPGIEARSQLQLMF